MKNFVPSVSNLYWAGKRLSLPLSLLVAIALTPSMLLAQVNDPTGAWPIRNDAEGSNFILTVFHKGGTLTGDVQGESAFLPGSPPPLNAYDRVPKYSPYRTTFSIRQGAV
jgi:hypothetical protein